MNHSLTLEERDDLIGEMLLLGLLGRIIYDYPGDQQRAWFQSLIESEAFSEAPFAADQAGVQAGLELLQNWAQAGISDESYLDMQVDYSRLFIGPGEVVAAPWESVMLGDDRQTFQEQTLAVRAWYRRFGLESEKLYREPDDHIGLEMIFLAHLANRALEALEAGEAEAFEELMAARRQFFSEHVQQWAVLWCDLVTQNARTDFYQGVGHLTKGALLYIAQQHEQQMAQEV